MHQNVDKLDFGSEILQQIEVNNVQTVFLYPHLHGGRITILLITVLKGKRKHKIYHVTFIFLGSNAKL